MVDGENRKEADKKKVLDTEDIGERETEKEIPNESETDKNVVINMVDENITNKVDKIPTHEGNKIYKCVRCKDIGRRIKDLVTHTKKKLACQYKCKVCKKNFIFKASLNQHTSKRHPEIKMIELP